MEQQQTSRSQSQQQSGSMCCKEGAWKEKIFSTSVNERQKIMEIVQNLFCFRNKLLTESPNVCFESLHIYKQVLNHQMKGKLLLNTLENINHL